MPFFLNNKIKSIDIILKENIISSYKFIYDFKICIFEYIYLEAIYKKNYISDTFILNFVIIFI